MSQATDFLTEWIQKAKVRPPSITVTLAQRWPYSQIPGHYASETYRPARTGYGYGINGSILEGIRDPGRPAGGFPHPTGTLGPPPGGIIDVGLSFHTVYLWFSDRGWELDLGVDPPKYGQPFLVTEMDVAKMELTFAGDAVQLQVQYTRAVAWDYNITATTTQVDQPSQQLLFSGLPPAGSDPVQAFMIVSLADTGELDYL